ncbi:MAG: hypothetical protein Q9228_006028, partial [Teloschistes exilis]
MASSVPLWAPGQGHGLEGQTTSWALYDPTMAETNKPMSVDKLNQNIIKDGSCIKHNVPKFVKLSDAAIGMMTLLLTTVMRHAYYGGDFNSNGQPSQGRPHVGNGFLIVDSSGQVLVGQVNHRKAKETYDLTGTKVSRTWPCYNINGRKALGAGYHMHTGSQSNRIVLHSNARQTRANASIDDELLELDSTPRKRVKTIHASNTSTPNKSTPTRPSATPKTASGSKF